MTAKSLEDASNPLETEKLFRIFIENMPLAIVVSFAGNIIFGNIAFQSMFGIISMLSVMGNPITDQVAPSCRKMVASHFRKKSKSGSRSEKFEVTAMRLDGSQFHCLITTTMLDLPNGMVFLTFFQDLTAQQEAQFRLEDSEAKLRNLAAHLLHAREEERKTVAREIHDEIGQNLTAIKMELQWIQKRVNPRSSPVMNKIQNTVGLVSQTIQLVHRISSELRPVILDDLGLAAAFEWLGGDFSKRNGIPCRVDVLIPGSQIAGRSAIALYRIVQEALINIAHHAKATRASVEVWEEDGCLHIRVIDDGIGITMEQASAPDSFGLIGIRERVQGLRGKVSITGQDEKGTTLLVVIPLPEEGGLS